MESMYVVRLRRRCSSSSSSRRRRSSCRSRAPTSSRRSAATTARSRPGFHILVPFVDRIAYKHNLKEEAMDIPEQVCITRDNVQVGVDGVLYMQVLDASRASYGITNYRFAIIAARADDAAQRDRQDRARPHVRGARHDQRERRRRARQGLRALGRQGAALRDQEHQPAEGRALGDGEADARRAREARGGADVRGRARRQDQPGRGREAARHQGVRGQQAAADQRGAGPGGGDPRGRDRDRRGPASRSARRCRAAAAPRRCSCASPRSTSSSSARSRPRRRARSSCRRTSPTSPR